MSIALFERDIPAGGTVYIDSQPATHVYLAGGSPAGKLIVSNENVQGVLMPIGLGFDFTETGHRWQFQNPLSTALTNMEIYIGTGKVNDNRATFNAGAQIGVLVQNPAPIPVTLGGTPGTVEDVNVTNTTEAKAVYITNYDGSYDRALLTTADLKSRIPYLGTDLIVSVGNTTSRRAFPSRQDATGNGRRSLSIVAHPNNTGVIELYNQSTTTTLDPNKLLAHLEPGDVFSTEIQAPLVVDSPTGGDRINYIEEYWDF